MPSQLKQEPLSNILPPLIFGCATFNTQYNSDPYALGTDELVYQALMLGIRAFDTSPYYGPSEELLAAALKAAEVRTGYTRSDYMILTKVGRIGSEEFDYSPTWIRQSIKRSLSRFDSSYLDLVYCHDVEFVSPEEAVEAVIELRRIRDEEGAIKYIGISGYPLEVLCHIAELVLQETGEPLDAVMSYANFTLQNTTLATIGVKRLRAAGVSVVPNASMLGLGLLRRVGPPSAGEDWHPAGSALRAAVVRASEFCDYHGERIEVVAIRFALESWLKEGSSVGSFGDPASGVPWRRSTIDELGGNKLGISVMGVSNYAELLKTMQVWRSILDGLENGQQLADAAGRWKKGHEWSLNRRKAIQLLAEGVKETLGDFYDHTWASPAPGYVNKRKVAPVGVSLPSPASSPEIIQLPKMTHKGSIKSCVGDS